MCLSPQVDTVAALAMTCVAVDALRHCDHRRLLGLALLPSIFAVHTFTSAVVWLGLLGDVSEQVLNAATVFYLLVAFVILPVYAPLSILIIEPRGWRRPALVLLCGAGAYAAADFLVGLLAGRGSAVACTSYIDFSIVSTSDYSAVAYVLATCGALLLSGQRILFIWGLSNIVVVAVLVRFVGQGLPSLWCLWAACSSVAVAWYLRRLRRERSEGGAWPWAPKPDQVRDAA
jgi:hypothetical protein